MIDLVHVPADPAHPDAWTVEGTVHVSDAVDLAIHGSTDFAVDVPTTRATLSEPHRKVHRLVAVPRGSREPRTVVGRAIIGLPLVGNAHVAVVYVAVHPDWRRRGIGSTLWDAGLAIARDAGRRVVISDSSYAPEPPPGPDALESPTGSGRIPLHDDATRFALARGFTLEQVVRHSVLDLPVAESVLGPLRRDPGPDYRVHTMRDEYAAEWLDQLAVLKTRMSTDAPSAGLDLTEDPWDADRVVANAADMRSRGQGFLVAVVEHVPTRTLAAFSMVEYPLDKPAVVFQGDTLVLREHRGNGLGMLAKIAVLDALPGVRPAAERIHTWNAQENAHMLAINVALGFRQASVDAEWQRAL
ncbi:GNAT family N-acetyltransferase [Cellulomonas humilata]|uniref:GNAT family N-acetyltransferase n=1 Tax=Cellulomonas humilata TaxID=144055 RepID=A0A7Y6A3P8_9CELL|nr:GNAT family N-acetyltransferase [Cellulomonas humilata]NUU19181.1 GNAT family N-acetyltransferase [Cellulomonas humilata]